MVRVNGALRLVILQFGFTNPDVIPPLVKRRQPELRHEREVRKAHQDGVLVIEPTESCSVLEFVHELEAAGYELVDAFHQARPARPDSTGPRYYHAVRFTFARREHVSISEKFRQEREAFRLELLEIARTSLWRVRVWSNPFYVEGVPSGETVLSANMEVREPLFHPDGTPVAVWPAHLKDKRKRRPEDQKVPVGPKFLLHALGDTIFVMEA